MAYANPSFDNDGTLPCGTFPTSEEDHGIPGGKDVARSRIQAKNKLEPVENLSEEVNKSNSKPSTVEIDLTHIRVDEAASSRNDKENYDPESGLEKPERRKDYSLCSYLQCFQCYRNFLGNFSEEKRKNLRKLLYTLSIAGALILYLIYFIVVLVVHSSQQEVDYWCSGDGILIILTTAVSSGVIYFQILKPYVFEGPQSILSRILSSSETLKKVRESCRSRLQTRYVSLLLYFVAAVAIIAFFVFDTTNDRIRLTSLFGILVLLFLGFLISKYPRKIVWRNVFRGLVVQLLFGLLILRWEFGRHVFECIGQKVTIFFDSTKPGSEFVFGPLGTEMAIFAFKIGSAAIFFALCIHILYYLGVMQWLVIKLGWVLQITLGTTACESANATGNIFLGPVASPLMIRPYIEKLTVSEFHCVLANGFATSAGPAIFIFTDWGVSASHLVAASAMSAPAALALAKLIYPEIAPSRVTSKEMRMVKTKEVNILHAAIEGIGSAVPLIVSACTNVIGFMSMVTFIDVLFNWVCLLANAEDGTCSLPNLLGYCFMPLSYVIGVAWEDCYTVGQLLATRTIFNEFFAFKQLGEIIKENTIGKRSEIIATYMMCGIGSIGAIGVNTGVFGALAPSRRNEMARLAIRSWITGNLASLLTACIAGTLISSDVISANATNSTGNIL